MDDQGLLRQIRRLATAVQEMQGFDGGLTGVQAQVCDFLRKFAGPHSSFLESARHIPGGTTHQANTLMAILENFFQYVDSGLHGEVSPARRVQLDVVNDFLDQAQRLLETNGVHTTAPIVLIGATLEEFLRTWVETAGLDIGQGKPSLDVYAKTLRSAELITKQDMKDITSWAGLRNDAAHGRRDNVPTSRERVALMLGEVGLFMRKYGA